MSHCLALDQTEMSLLAMKLFAPICSSDANTRRDALEFLDDGLKAWSNGKIPVQVTSKLHLKQGDPEDEKLLSSLSLQSCLPFLLMWANQCPFSDVREKLSESLMTLKMCRVTVPSQLIWGPSSFVPLDEAISPSTNKRESNLLCLQLGTEPRILALRSP
ncbi:uncharacterized protein LOC111089424 [Limulus polyphemus]|uniref:Uncharacterized protein LOC111089424 n=1 Tax=Limulus polyphemus TaxID=6850 RepID=A0ABM1TNZ3_LIMPO|nr:uncharacterized protein LOC111089424 [Limulus polyphemus]